jgi:hypothetical protein
MLTITVDFDAGDRIDNAFEQSIELANKLGFCIEFKFNEVTCWAYPNTSSLKGVQSYHESLKSKHKIASSK